MQARTSQSKAFLPAVILMLFFMMLLVSFGGRNRSAEPEAGAKAEQCNALCDAMEGCIQEQMQAFALAGCAEYPCQKEADCTSVTCGSNTPEELRQALGC